MPAEVQKHLFTVREFHQMAQGGVFAEDDRVELLAGEIFEMMPIGSRHAGWVNAQAGIPEAWLIVLNGNAVDVYDDPSPDGYRAHRRFERGEQVTSQQFPALTVAVSDLV